METELSYTDSARNKLEFLETKLAPVVYESLQAELSAQYKSQKVSDYVNLGDVYRAADALGINLDLIK